MKHSKVWLTCDRCGHNIDEKPLLGNFLGNIKIPKQLRMEYVNRTGYITNERLLEPLAPEILSATLVVSNERKSKSYDLCPKCRKEFERWMKNEHGSSN